MMKILLFTKYDESGASSRYRTLQYLKHLRENNIHVTVNTLLDEEYVSNIYKNKKIPVVYYFKKYLKRFYWLLFKAKHYDCCWIEYELFPYMPFFLEKWFLPKKFIVDYDDAIFHNYDQHPNPIMRIALKNKIAQVMRSSQQVVAGNEYLKQYALNAGANNITIIPTVVDSKIFRPLSYPSESETVVIGWVGSPFTVKYLAILESVFIALAKIAKIKLFVIGAKYKINGVEAEYYQRRNGWSQEKEIHLLNTIDIGVMPLHDSPWERGKCSFKLIEYMACAKPVVASPVSSNMQVVQHGITGYLAYSEKEWEEFLLDFINDPRKRKKFGNAGRERMIKHYNLEVTLPVLETIIRSSRH